MSLLLGVVAHTYSPSTQRAEAGRTQVSQGLQANLNYIIKLCLLHSQGPTLYC